MKKISKKTLICSALIVIGILLFVGSIGYGIQVAMDGLTWDEGVLVSALFLAGNLLMNVGQTIGSIN